MGYILDFYILQIWENRVSNCFVVVSIFYRYISDFLIFRC